MGQQPFKPVQRRDDLFIPFDRPMELPKQSNLPPGPPNRALGQDWFGDLIDFLGATVGLRPGVESPTASSAGVLGSGVAAAMTAPIAGAKGLLGMKRLMGPRAPITDLPLDHASRMQRARSMGFDVDNVMYHGSPSGRIGAFDRTVGGSNTGARDGKLGIFLSDDPQIASDAAQWQQGGTLTLPRGRVRDKLSTSSSRFHVEGLEAQVKESLFKQFERSPAYLAKQAEVDQAEARALAVLNEGNYDSAKYRELDFIANNKRQALERMKGEYWQSLVGSSVLSTPHRSPTVYPLVAKMNNPAIENFRGQSYDEQRIIDALREAKLSGHDSMIIPNIRDMGSDQPSSQYVVFSPHQLRSPWANFDPKMAKNGNLLAGILGPVLAAQLMGRNQR